MANQVDISDYMWTADTQVTDVDTLVVNKINEMQLKKKRTHTMMTRSMSNQVDVLDDSWIEELWTADTQVTDVDTLVVNKIKEMRSKK